MRRATETLRRELADLEARQLLRRRRVVVPAPAAGGGAVPDASPGVLVDGRRLCNFCSNDYLGLARHPALASALASAAARLGTGSGASHLVSGHGHEHHALEEELAAFVGRDRALLFSSGYLANLGVIASFARRGEVVLQDRLNHASLLDAARLAGSRLLRYAHGDAQAASALLASQPRTAVLATDAVFSMDGDIAPLAALAAACRAQAVWLLVDDAHGFGLRGPHGAGTVAAASLGSDAVPLLMATLGKALGTCGAFVAGDSDAIEYLLQRARTYIYTTALPPALAAATRTALRVCREEPWRRTHLDGLVARFRHGAATLGLPLLPSPTAIQPLLLGDAARALALAESLESAGFLVAAIRPPTVPVGSARLRVTLSAAHSEADIVALLSALADRRRLWEQAA